jgi:hypothetical protein
MLISIVAPGSVPAEDGIKWPPESILNGFPQKHLPCRIQQIPLRSGHAATNFKRMSAAAILICHFGVLWKIALWRPVDFRHQIRTNRMHWIMQPTVSFRNVEGNGIVKTEFNSRFFGCDCGSVRPGESVIIK